MASLPASAAALDPAYAAARERDPVWAAILAAPLAKEPETDEERAAFEAIEADIQAGRHGLSPAEVATTIEQMRLEKANELRRRVARCRAT